MSGSMRVFVVATILSTVVAAVYADTHTWTGLGDGINWSDPDNWSPAELPLTIGIGDGADTVVIDGAHSVVVDADVISVAGVTIDGGATLTIASGVELSTNNLDIISGGLILQEVGGAGAMLDWGKANRGRLYVEADGYIAGVGTIRTYARSEGVQIRSRRSADFDMTAITLQLAYYENLTVCSADLGRDDIAPWAASNYTIGTLYFSDRRTNHLLGGTINVNALYCLNLRFGGDADESASLNIQGLNVYVRDRITWADGSVVDTPTELTIGPVHDDLDRPTSLWDDTAVPGQAFVGAGLSPNDNPVADAGPDQSVIDTDGDGFELVQLDGTASMDIQGPIAAYDWSEGGSPLATGAAPQVTLAVGVHTITLTVTDDDGVTDDDTVVITVQDQAVLYPPTADAGPDQSLTDADDDGFESVTLDGTGSGDSDGFIVGYSWSNGGVEIAAGATPTVQLTPCEHHIELTVTDDFGLTGADTVVITIDRIDPPVPVLPLTNRQSGISVGLSGENGKDWAVEQSYHDMAVGDQMIYLRSDVEISLAHNANNSLMNRDVGLPGVIGVGGLDGVPDNGDEGDIHWKIDRDMQSHGYTTVGTSIPTWAPLYAAPLCFDTLTYEGVTAVLGAIGDNGQAWGGSPAGTQVRFAYGQLDRFGNEWHTLTYWDDDGPVYAAAGVSAHRQGASDGHWVYICVDPVTPVIQFTAPAGEQFYTTPLKTYHVPKTWDQTTYLTPGVLLGFVNLTNCERVQYRVNGGPWQTYYGGYLVAADLFTNVGGPNLLEVRAGEAAAIGERAVVLGPDYPGPEEEHGYMLWANDTEKQAVRDKLSNVQPFKVSYQTFLNSYYQSSGAVYTDARGGWRSGAGMASVSLSNAFAAAIDGPEAHPDLAALAKQRLLRMARLEAVGFEAGVSLATPSKDYLNELGQTIQQFADAGVAYDLLASCYRQSHHADGMTPIEELRIRDGLAEIAKTILQVRDNWSYISGGGDTHWAHGYELAFGILAAAMPTYATPYFGVSGGDMTTINDLSDAAGEFWNPFPHQGVTWYEAATDPEIDTPGHPNVKAPLRAEFLLTDEGYWTGPNDLQGDGDRYATGPTGRRLVDVKYGGLANAENRVELVEMSGYESPFVGRLHVLDFVRRIRHDADRQQCVTNYIRRRQLTGYIPLSWDGAAGVYTPGAGRVVGSLLGFNNYFEGAAMPSSMALMTEFLTDVNRYYGYEPGTPSPTMESDRKTLYNAYALALCADPDTLAPPVADANHAPIIKPMFKYVVAPGATVVKYVLAMDLDGDALTVTVADLPAGASFNPTERRIQWTPTTGDLGVHVITVTADDGTISTSKPFPILVKSVLGVGPIPAGPANVTATMVDNDAHLSWEAPGGVPVARYVIYRDGALHDVVPAGRLTYVDADLPAGSHTRYHIAVYDTNGAESGAAATSPAIVSLPHAAPGPVPGDANDDGKVDLNDFVILKQNWAADPLVDDRADFNNDGKIDLEDFVILKQNWGAPPATGGTDAGPTGSTDPDDTAPPAATAPAQKTAVPDNDPEPAFRRGAPIGRAGGSLQRGGGSLRRAADELKRSPGPIRR